MYAVEDNLLEVLSKFKPKWKRIGLRLKEEVEVSAVKLNLSCNKCLQIELPQTEFYLSEQPPQVSAGQGTEPGWAPRGQTRAICAGWLLLSSLCAFPGLLYLVTTPNIYPLRQSSVSKAILVNQADLAVRVSPKQIAFPSPSQGDVVPCAEGLLPRSVRLAQPFAWLCSGCSELLLQYEEMRF